MRPDMEKLEKIVESLRKKLGDDLICLLLFGSAARGEMRENSDMDILLIAQNLPEKRYERIQFLRKDLPSVGLGHPIGFIAYTPE